MNMHVLFLSYYQLQWGNKRNQILKIPLPRETSTLLMFMLYSSAMKINIKFTAY